MPPLSNGATSTANASQNDMFLGLINYVYLNVLFYSASVKTLLLPPSPQAVLNVVGGGCVCAC